MKALTLTQPWATLVVTGEKQFETRSWQTSYRGKIAIHAAKGFPVKAKYLCLTQPFHSSLNKIFPDRFAEDQFKLGYVIGTVEIIDCYKIGENGELMDYQTNKQIHWIDKSTKEFAFGDYTPGRFAWLLTNPVRFSTPIPAKGALSLWNWEPPNPFLELLAI